MPIPAKPMRVKRIISITRNAAPLVEPSSETISAIEAELTRKLSKRTLDGTLTSMMENDSSIKTRAQALMKLKLRLSSKEPAKFWYHP
ncbi:MAG: hypothetical protein NTY48_00115 [Candidatus Diapherotrites archaeon]|nr:hypothetical protein [Candidatus Diapherotrites archaeon]